MLTQMSTIAASIMGISPITRYLSQCQSRNLLAEGDQDHVPPTASETKDLLAYLDSLGIKAAVVGSVGILHYVKGDFRPTSDLDLHVKCTFEQFRKVAPLQGWSVDRESIGVISWISPGGGYVDFLCAGSRFADGGKVLSTVTVDKTSRDYPVASAADIFKLKLSSMRSKDLTDLISLARGIGHVPAEEELGHLNQTQRENLELIQQWYSLGRR